MSCPFKSIVSASLSMSLLYLPTLASALDDDTGNSDMENGEISERESLRPNRAGIFGHYQGGGQSAPQGFGSGQKAHRYQDWSVHQGWSGGQGTNYNRGGGGQGMARRDYDHSGEWRGHYGWRGIDVNRNDYGVYYGGGPTYYNGYYGVPQYYGGGAYYNTGYPTYNAYSADGYSGYNASNYNPYHYSSIYHPDDYNYSGYQYNTDYNQGYNYPYSQGYYEGSGSAYFNVR